MAQMVKNLPAMQETVPSLGREEPLEKGMASHSSILAWRIPWTEEPGGLQSMGSLRVDTTEWLTLALSFSHLLYPPCVFQSQGSLQAVSHTVPPRGLLCPLSGPQTQHHLPGTKGPCLCFLLRH